MPDKKSVVNLLTATVFSSVDPPVAEALSNWLDAPAMSEKEIDDDEQMLQDYYNEICPHCGHKNIYCVCYLNELFQDPAERTWTRHDREDIACEVVVNSRVVKIG